MEQLIKARPRVANPIKNQADSTKRAQEAKAEGVKLGFLPKDIAPMSREALQKISNADLIDYMRQHYIKQGLPADEVRRMTLANGARELFQRYGKKFSEASIRGQLATTLDQHHQKNPNLFGTNQSKQEPQATPQTPPPVQQATPVTSYHEKVQSALAHPDKVYGRSLYEQASREHYFKKHKDELENLSEEEPDKYVELMTQISSKIKGHADKLFPVEAVDPVKTQTETSGLRADKDYKEPKPRVRRKSTEDDSPEAREERHMARVNASLNKPTAPVATPKPKPKEVAAPQKPTKSVESKQAVAQSETPVIKEPTPEEIQALVDRQKANEEYAARQSQPKEAVTPAREPKKVTLPLSSDIKNFKLTEQPTQTEIPQQGQTPAEDRSYANHKSFKTLSNYPHANPERFAKQVLRSNHFGWLTEPGNLDKFVKHHGYDLEWVDRFHKAL
jgi:hypothetical protein